MSRYVFQWIAATVAVFITTSYVMVAQERDPNRPSAGLSQAGKLDSKTTGSNIRASQLIGMNVYNAEGKSLAKINDLVIDGSMGNIRYAAVSYGGFLGLGDKLFAVPWSAFKMQQTPNSSENRLILNLNEGQLKGATGFDKNNWPDFGDRSLTDKLDQYYGVRRDDVNHDRTASGVGVNVNGSGVQVDVNRK